MQIIPCRRTDKLSVCISKQTFRLSLHNNFFDIIFSSRPFFLLLCATAQSVPEPHHSRGFWITHKDAADPDRTPLDELSARPRDLYLTTHNNHNRQTSMPSVRFEPTISACDRPQTPHLPSRGHWDRRSITLQN